MWWGRTFYRVEVSLVINREILITDSQMVVLMCHRVMFSTIVRGGPRTVAPKQELLSVRILDQRLHLKKELLKLETSLG